jgi:hypothetical protein
MLCSFEEALARPVESVGEEARFLGAALRSGAFDVVPGLVILSLAEEGFYLSNNLPEQLGRLFARINPRRLDEDALEAACERARALVISCVLLEDFNSVLEIALRNLRVSGTLHLRRPGETASEAGEGKRGALIALKRLWARDWEFDAVLERLDDGGSVALDARPALLFAGALGEEDPDASARASELLARPLSALSSAGLLNGLLPR